jgi:RNA polymerase sigma-70 factor (ECF subfamily)
MSVSFSPIVNDSRTNDLIKHVNGLYGYASSLTRNPTDAEDLVQETYVRAINAIGSLREDSNLQAWLFTILRNLWLNQLRRSRRLIHVDDADLERFDAASTEETYQDPHLALTQGRDREAVRRAIESLSIRDREVILLREFEGLPYQRISEIQQCPMGTVMSRLARARSRLRVILSKSHCETVLRTG